MNFSDWFIKEYNKEVARLPKAEEFLSKFGGSVEFVHHGKKAYTLDMVLKMYNELIIKLSNLQQQYKNEYGVEMSLEEKEKGFVI